ncbi:MAG: hypothetical protein M0Q95_13830 [Porticoccaceae bacterium]|nr:hypothetical protein [Porticoccaceae bacterium]
MWHWSTAFFTIALVAATMGFLGIIDIFAHGSLITLGNLLLGVTWLMISKPPGAKQF